MNFPSPDEIHQPPTTNCPYDDSNRLLTSHLHQRSFSPARCWLVGEYPNGSNANYWGIKDGTNAFIAELGDSILQEVRPTLIPNIKLSLYPNPSFGELTVESSTAQSHLTAISVFSVDGKLMSTEPCASKISHQISLGTLPAGVYLIGIEVNHRYLYHEKVVLYPRN